MKKLISFLLSITLCSSMMTIFPAASWDLNEEQAVEGDISSYVQVEEVTFGEPEPIAEPLNEEELYQLEWVGDLFEAETETDEAQPMADLPDLSVRNLKIEAGDMTSPYPAGMAMYYTFQLLNYGTADAENAEVIVKLDGAVATNPVPMGTVPAGKGGNIQFRGPEMTPGTHTMEIVVNPDNKIVESNYNNNTTSSSFTYKACFELIALSMTSNKQIDESTVPTYEVGDSVTFTMDFQNIGLLDAKNVPIALYGTFREPGGQPVTSQMGYTNYIEELPAKTRMQAEVKLNFTKEASARISFVLDPEKILGDMDYSNNMAEALLKVVGARKTAVIVASKHGENDPEHPGHDFTGFASDTYAEYQKLESGTPSFDVYLKTQPTSTMLRGNLGEKKLMASDVITLFGHANFDNQIFHYDNKGGIYKCGVVYFDHDWDSPDSGHQYVGLKSEDMQSVDLISFIGCKTAYKKDNQTNLTICAVERGAKTAVGFKDTIYPWMSDGGSWIAIYANALASGNTVGDAIWIANTSEPYSTLAQNVVIEGDINTRLGDVNTRLIDVNPMKQIDQFEGINKVELNIPYNASVMTYSDTQIKQGKDMLNGELLSEMKKLNPNFETDYYKVMHKTYGSDLQTITLFKVIPTEVGNVMTDVNYTISIRDDVAFLLTYSDQPTLEMLQKEKAIPERIQEFVKNGGENNVELPDIPNAEVNVDEDHVYYQYNYEKDELSYVVGYEITHLDEDGALSADEIVVQIP